MGSQSARDDLERLRDRPARISTGFKNLDTALGGGFSTGALTLIAERREAHSLGFLLEAVRRTLNKGRPAMVLSEFRSQDSIRDELVGREARVNRFRFDSGLVSGEDRIALAAARKRLPWDKLVVVAGRAVALPEIDELLFSYRPLFLVADLRPRAPQASRPRRLDSWLEGAERLASLARRHRVAVVLLQALSPEGEGPSLEELPGGKAAADSCTTLIGVHLNAQQTKRELTLLRRDGESSGETLQLRFDARLDA